MDYPIPDGLKGFFEEVVNKPFVEYPRTDAWILEVVEHDSYYHTREILERGTADFNTFFKELTPHEKVIIYCYYYMQMHVVSSFHVFKESHFLFSEYILNDNKNIIFIDFGCGPLTSGVALAWYYQSLGVTKLHDFHYIGIDRCESMIRKAREISVRPGWKNCTFDFLKSYKSHDYIIELLEMYVSSGRYEEYLIVLNSSYLFASSTLDVGNLVTLVKKILNSYKSHKVCLTYQNPPVDSLNNNWDNFKKSFPELCPVVVDKQAKLSYRNITGRIRRSENTHIELYFETLVRE